MANLHKMPHPMAELSFEKQQEINITYVAFTRSKDKMYFIDTLIPTKKQFIV